MNILTHISNIVKYNKATKSHVRQK